MENVTLKQFVLDIAAIIVFSILFAAVFIYGIPALSVRAWGNDSKMQDQARANAYHQYLIRKGVIND